MGLIALWLAFGLTLSAGVIVARRLGRFRRAPGTQVSLGLGIGLVAAFVLIALQSDLVPDDIEWIGIVGIIAIAAAWIVVLFVRSLVE